MTQWTKRLAPLYALWHRVGERERRVRMCEPHPDDRMDSKSRPCESAERGVSMSCWGMCDDGSQVFCDGG